MDNHVQPYHSYHFEKSIKSPFIHAQFQSQNQNRTTLSSPSHMKKKKKTSIIVCKREKTLRSILVSNRARRCLFRDGELPLCGNSASTSGPSTSKGLLPACTETRWYTQSSLIPRERFYRPVSLRYFAALILAFGGSIFFAHAGYGRAMGKVLDRATEFRSVMVELHVEIVFVLRACIFYFCLFMERWIAGFMGVWKWR